MCAVWIWTGGWKSVGGSELCSLTSNLGSQKKTKGDDFNYTYVSKRFVKFKAADSNYATMWATFRDFQILKFSFIFSTRQSRKLKYIKEK